MGFWESVKNFCFITVTVGEEQPEEDRYDNECEANPQVSVVARGDSYEEVITDLIAEVRASFLQHIPVENIKIPWDLTLVPNTSPISSKAFVTQGHFVTVRVPGRVDEA